MDQTMIKARLSYSTHWRGVNKNLHLAQAEAGPNAR